MESASKTRYGITRRVYGIRQGRHPIHRMAVYHQRRAPLYIITCEARAGNHELCPCMESVLRTAWKRAEGVRAILLAIL
ncbi:MAG: hypothetical protein E7609_05520 [Ruminococcaceae bacterium]|nr:hypothetical protein [Oscillospiraceae bacterium]